MKLNFSTSSIERPGPSSSRRLLALPIMVLISYMRLGKNERMRLYKILVNFSISTVVPKISPGMV